MEITYELTEEDYIQFNFYHLENSPSQRNIFQLSRFALPLVMTVPIYLFGTQVFHQPSAYWLVIAILFVVGWIIAYPKKFQRSLRKQLVKMLREKDNTFFYGKKTLRLDGDNISVFNEKSTDFFTKSAIMDIKIYDDMILLYLNAVAAQIIPTRFLSTDSYKRLVNELPIDKKSE